MPRRRFRPLALALAAAALLLPLAASPASATHQNGAAPVYGHWGNSYSPPVYTNYSPSYTFSTGQTPFALVQDAGYFWQNRYFVQGWNPGAFPAYSAASCDDPGGILGAIFVCFVPPTSPWLDYGVAKGKVYLSTQGYCDNPPVCNHIYTARVFMANNFTDGGQFQRVMRHEFGHALGLAHNNHGDQYQSVMRGDAPVFDTATSDIVAVYNMYVGHTSG